MPDTSHIATKPAAVVMPLIEKTVRDSNRWVLETVAERPGRTIISFLNAHAVNTAAINPDFARFLLESDVLLRDGIGIKLATRLLKLPDTPNLNGTDLTPLILRQLRDRTIALFGTTDAVLAECEARLRQEGIFGVVCKLHGFHSDAAYLDAFARHQPEVTILCMGMPRQELLAAKLPARTDRHVVISAGGWADFYSGRKPRAPEWVRNLRLEWLHRLAHEPSRLGKRYTIDLVKFFSLLMRAKSQTR